MRRRTVLTTTTTLLAATALLWACRDVSTLPAGSASNPAAYRATVDRDFVHGARGRAVACSKRQGQHGHAHIGPHGGRIVLGNNAVIVPPGALDDEVDITATVPADTIAEIQLAPHGLRFELPVLLVFDAAGCALGDDDDVPVAYVDDAGNILEWLEGTRSPNGRTVTAAIHHFSGYILAF